MKVHEGTLFPSLGATSHLAARLIGLARNLQRAIEAKFEDRAFFKAEVVVAHQRGRHAERRAAACTDACAFTTVNGSSSDGPYASAYGRGFDGTFLAHALAFEIALFVGDVDR